MKKNIVRVGLVQMRAVEDPKKNMLRALSGIKNGAKRGAQIVCLPELFKTQYFCQTKNKKFFDLAEPVPGPTVKILGEAARENNVAVITSVYERTAGGTRRAGKVGAPGPVAAAKFFNTAVVIDANGRYAGKYRKMHIPDDLKNYYGEAHYFEKGDLGFRVFKTKYAAVGPMVCWDQWFPEGARACAAKGAQILFYPTAIGRQVKDKHGVNDVEYQAWQTIQRAHAIANNIFVVAVNRVGRENHLNFWGTSFVADPYGRVIARAPSDSEADLIVDCDLSLIKQMRADWPFLDARRIKF